VLLAIAFFAGWVPTALESISREPTPGWKRFKTPDVSLDLPTSYSGGETNGADLDEVVSTLRGIGDEDKSSLADAIQAGRTQFAFWAFDLDSLSSASFPTGVSISSTAMVLDSNVGLADVANLIAQASPQFDVKDSEPVQLGSFQGHRLKIATRSLGVDIEQAMYLVRKGNTVWKITFATPASEFETRLTTFDQSVQSLALN